MIIMLIMGVILMILAFWIAITGIQEVEKYTVLLGIAIGSISVLCLGLYYNYFHVSNILTYEKGIYLNKVKTQGYLTPSLKTEIENELKNKKLDISNIKIEGNDKLDNSKPIYLNISYMFKGLSEEITY